MTKTRISYGFAVVFAVISCCTVAAEKIPAPATMTLSGDWTVKVEYAGRTAELAVEPAVVEQVVSEKHGRMPPYDERRTWNPPLAPNRIRGEEGFPTTFALDVDSVVVRAGEDAASRTFEKDKDYHVMEKWGSIGRTPDSAIPENRPVWIDYRYGKMRIDSVVLTGNQMEIRRGEPHIVMPEPPELKADEIRLGNIWIKARIERLEPDLLFPILEASYPEPVKADGKSIVELLLPKTSEKLKSGATIKILAWGDSVTVGSYLKNPQADRWQEQFVRRLRKRFPEAKIELLTEACGGRGSGTYLAEPPGSVHNFKEKILDLTPDLVVMEFVNDAGLHGEALEKQYGRILEAFRGIGTEWIILTPHYVRTDWMGLNREREIDDDPRPYTRDVRRFAKSHGIAVADAAARYGRLWRQGIPYSTLMSNNINHPNEIGMSLFADALMELFPKSASEIGVE